VFARKEAVDNGLIDFALEVTKKSIDFFENEYFDSSLRALPPKIGRHSIIKSLFIINFIFFAFS
jgi:hypothetical protein